MTDPDEIRFLIVNPRLGTPGTEFVARPGVNVAALLESGAIVPVMAIVDGRIELGKKDAPEPQTSRRVTRKTPKE